MDGDKGTMGMDADGRGAHCLARVLNAVRETGRCVALRQSEESTVITITDLGYRERLKVRVIGDPEAPGPWLDLARDLDRKYRLVHGDRQPGGPYIAPDFVWPAVMLRDVVDVIRSAATEAIRACGGDLIRDWYLGEFPGDPLGAHIDPTVTFSDLLEVARDNPDPADLDNAAFRLLGVPDAFVAGAVLHEMRGRIDVSETLPPAVGPLPSSADILNAARNAELPDKGPRDGSRRP